MNKVKATICRSFIELDKQTKKQPFTEVLQNLLNKLKSNNLNQNVFQKALNNTN